MRYIRSTLRQLGLALFVLGLALSPAAWDTLKLLFMEGSAAIADYRLRHTAPEQYAEATEAALRDDNPDLARSLVALADIERVTLPDALRQQVAALPAVDMGNLLQQGYECIVNGDFETEAGFACVVATDLTSVGDVRDLLGEGAHYVTGQPVNYLTLGLAGAGLTLTAMTVGTGGGALPLRVGASFMKSVAKAGKVPPRLVAQIGGALARSFDGKALQEAMQLAGEFRLAEVGRPLSRLFSKRSVDLVTGLAEDFGTIGKAGGVRAMKASLVVLDDARDAKRAAEVAKTYDRGYLGVVKLLGRGAIRLGDLVVHVAAWLVGALLWLLMTLTTMVRWSIRGARWTSRGLYGALRFAFARRPQARLEVAAA